jgi:hypothetical protein
LNLQDSKNFEGLGLEPLIAAVAQEELDGLGDLVEQGLDL